MHLALGVGRLNIAVDGSLGAVAASVEDALDLIAPVAVTVVTSGTGGNCNAPSTEGVLGVVGVDIVRQVCAEGRLLLLTTLATGGNLLVVVLACHAVLLGITVARDAGPLGAIGRHRREEEALLADSHQVVGHGTVLAITHDHALSSWIARLDVALHPPVGDVHVLLAAVVGQLLEQEGGIERGGHGEGGSWG